MNVFKKYSEYINDNPEGLWFKRKLYGWGWTPATKEGWFVTLAYIIFILGLGLIADDTSDKKIILTFVAPVIALTVIFLVIARNKGEKPCWQWGKRKE